MGDNTKRYIAVHLGATGGKVVLASVAAGKVTTETVHSFPIPSVNIDGYSLWDIYAAYAEVLKGLSAVGSRKLPVESVGIDAWGPGIVCVAKDGSFLGLPRVMDDVLSESVQARFFKRLERRELYEASGVNVLDSHAALQLFSMYREKRIALDDAKYLLFIPEAVAFLLTGKRFTEFTSLSGAGLVDRRKHKVSRDVLSACKVRPKRFPSVVQPGTKVAKLSEEVAQATGLGRVQVLAVAGHDVASASVAVPYGISTVSDTLAVHFDSPSSPSHRTDGFGAEGAAFLILDDVSVMGVETASPIVNDQTFEMNFSNEAGPGGVNLLVKRIAGVDLLERCVASWRAAGRAYGPEDLARMAREGSGINAQLDPEDPTLLSAVPPVSIPGSVSPSSVTPGIFTDSAISAAIKRYCSLRSMAVPADDAALVRLIYTSLAEKIGDTFIKLQSVTPFRIKALHIVGSGTPFTGTNSGLAPGLFLTDEGTVDPVLCQLVADECSVPVTAGPADAAVLGNILVQAGGVQTGSGRSALTRAALDALSIATYTPGLN
ncbi:MAG: hypothetical protein IKR72_00365 [Bacteroidales bacterium]|nr:hypothetical protein [Bacteroidales bacterium]